MKIVFTLSNFFENLSVNNFIIYLSRTCPEVFKSEISIIAASGGFPYCYWCGDINRNYGSGAYYTDFERLYTNSAAPLRFNFANVLLDETDFLNVMGNQILKSNHNGSNLIEISNFKFLEYIKEKYPNYKFIMSKNSDFINPMTIDIINDAIECQVFELIGLPDYYINNFEELKKIKQRNKIELTVDPICPLKCKNFYNCRITEQKSEIEYSGKSIISSCEKKNLYGSSKTILTLEDIEKNYLPLGINHFCFSPYFIPIETLFNFYLDYFIKKDCYSKVLTMWKQGNNKRS